MTRGAYKGMGGLIPEFYGILLIIDSIMPARASFPSNFFSCAERGKPGI